MCNSMVNDLEEKGVVMYDASLNQECLVIAPVICFLCDNVRASEIVNHLGSPSNKYCRMCQVFNFHKNNNVTANLYTTVASVTKELIQQKWAQADAAL